MLTYTFSKREKVLLVILAVILLAVVYYRFIFVAVNDQVDSLESQIAATEDQITVDTAKSLELKSMQAAIEDYQAAGRSQIVMPAYDNITPLMASLNGTLAGTNNFSLSFDELDGSESGLVKRGVTLDFTCADYATARSVIDALAKGQYPCSIESVSITDNVATSASTGYGIAASGSGDGARADAYAVTAHLTFYERGTLPGTEADASAESTGASAAE
jgi:hypothetical protein